MGEKGIAGLVTFAAVLPLCALCVLGPAAAVSILAGLGAWVGGPDLWLVVPIAAAGAGVVYRLVRRRRPARGVCRPGRSECRQ